jgi:sugar/nucleoside kinase (ribokinase family)
MIDRPDSAEEAERSNRVVRVGCAGILVADTFCGPLDALPREGELVAINGLPISVGGCAANVAISLVRQGFIAEVAGCLGRDYAAKIVVSSLERSGVGCQHLVYSDTLPTSQTIVLLVKGQDRRYLHVFGANSALKVAHTDRDWVRDMQVFYIGGLYVMPGIAMDELADLLQYCGANGVTTVADVIAPGHFTDFSGLRQVLPHVDFFLPNEDEARVITGCTDELEQIDVLRSWGARTVVITRGNKGLTAAAGNDYWRAGPFSVDTVDPTGSGDAFAAGLITGILRDWDLPDMLRYASALGASATLAVGTTTSVFTAQEADQFLGRHTLDIVKL